MGSQKSLFFQHLGSLQQASLLNASFSGKHGFCDDFESPKNEPNESNFFFLVILVCSMSELPRFKFSLKSEQFELLFEPFNMLPVFDKLKLFGSYLNEVHHMKGFPKKYVNFDCYFLFEKLSCSRTHDSESILTIKPVRSGPVFFYFS